MVRRLVVASLVWLVASLALGQTRRLIPGGSRSHFGVLALSGGYAPNPREVAVISGGNLDVRSMRLGPGCLGFAMDRPDVILRYADPAPRLAVAARAGGDTTLVVHTPDGRWLCDDDGGGGLHPRVEVEAPPAGQYDIWVGSYRADQHLETTLFIEEG